MGSSFNRAIFEDHIQVKLTGWAQNAKRNKGQKNAAGTSKVSHKESSPLVQNDMEQSKEADHSCLEIERAS